MAAAPRLGGGLSRLTTLIVLCIIVLSCDYAFARGGRSGGGSRSGSSSRSSSSYRSSSSSVRTKVRISTTNVRYGSRFYVIPPTVHIYGYSYYKTRHLYVSSHNDDPTVCYSEVEGDNGTSLGYFICPMAEDEDSATYCCGDDDEQYCCDFWGDPGRTAGAVIGIIAAIILTIVFIALLKKCCCPSNATTINHKDIVVTTSRVCESVPLTSMPPVAAPVAYPCAVPIAGSAAMNAYESVPQPDFGLPYPPQPGATYEGSQATGIGLPYPVSGPPAASHHYSNWAGESQVPPYPAGGASGAAPNPAPASGQSQASIGFEGVTQPPFAGSAAPYPPGPPGAQAQPQPPSYSEAVRL